MKQTSSSDSGTANTTDVCANDDAAVKKPCRVWLVPAWIAFSFVAVLVIALGMLALCLFRVNALEGKVASLEERTYQLEVRSDGQAADQLSSAFLAARTAKTAARRRARLPVSSRTTGTTRKTWSER
ncbi:hypothetical protein HPB51_025099 [Rhipicephalus microplus]|uniref:Uncharacterized protein n=1 Tax=Rhipicephalus microplus TaxID=6941 RepID=A0A9J6DL12_RHIMP|nr:hypothetical protein HPB51_025099 [Rhipicephalus microplus]